MHPCESGFDDTPHVTIRAFRSLYDGERATGRFDVDGKKEVAVVHLYDECFSVSFSSSRVLKYANFCQSANVSKAWVQIKGWGKGNDDEKEWNVGQMEEVPGRFGIVDI